MSGRYTNLSALNKQSAKVATFLVKVVRAEMQVYTYLSKRDGSEQKGKRWECYLLGEDPEMYCVGFVRGSDDAMKKAALRFVNGSVWVLSKSVLDTSTNIAYISSPLKMRLDLGKSSLVSPTTAPAKELPAAPMPPRTVAETDAITSARATDLIALVKNVSETRSTKTRGPVATVVLVDGSCRKGSSDPAAVEVSVFGNDKIELLRTVDASPVVFFNLQVKVAGLSREINHWENAQVEKAPDSARKLELEGKAEALLDEQNATEVLTTSAFTHAPRDVSGDQPLSVCAFLDFMSDDASAVVPEVVQIFRARLQEPQASDDIFDASSGKRLWFVATLSDISGSVRVGVPERAALKLSSCGNWAAFQKKT